MKVKLGLFGFGSHSDLKPTWNGLREIYVEEVVIEGGDVVVPCGANV